MSTLLLSYLSRILRADLELQILCFSSTPDKPRLGKVQYYVVGCQNEGIFTRGSSSIGSINHQNIPRPLYSRRSQVAAIFSVRITLDPRQRISRSFPDLMHDIDVHAQYYHAVYPFDDQ